MRDRKAQFQASPIGANEFDEHLTKLNAEDLGEIFAYYRKKHGIRLIRNGDFHKHIVEANIAPFVAQLEAINDKEFSNYNFLKICKISDSASINSLTSISRDEGDLCTELCNFLKSKGYMKNNRLREDLNWEQIIDIETFCQKNLSDQAKKILDEKKVGLSRFLKRNIENRCLTKDQAIAEILDIQKSLGEDEKVGYVFTNNQRGKNSAHFEAVIITKHEIIKPVEWPFQPLRSTLYHRDEGLNSIIFFSPRLDFMTNDDPPSQQVDQSHCGVLCVSYLKKLLQDDGKALFKDSLRVPLYDKNGVLNYVFIPPPSIMQYSQSGKFIKFYQNLMGNVVEASEDQPMPKDLKELLLESKERALAQYDPKTAEINQDLLDNFDDFSEKWLQGCKEACEKRNKLFNNDDKSSFNLYLAYAAKRLLDEVHSPKEERVEQDSTAGKKQEKEQEATNAHVKESQEDTVEAGANISQTEVPPQTSIPQTEQPPVIKSQALENVPSHRKDPKEQFKEDLQEYVFKRMSEAGSHDFASHHRTKIITLKFGYSAEQKIAAVNKLIYALDMQDKLGNRPKEMELTETDIGALTTSRLYGNVIKKHLGLFNQILDELPEKQNLKNSRFDI